MWVGFVHLSAKDPRIEMRTTEDIGQSDTVRPKVNVRLYDIIYDH